MSQMLWITPKDMTVDILVTWGDMGKHDNTGRSTHSALNLCPIALWAKLPGEFFSSSTHSFC